MRVRITRQPPEAYGSDTKSLRVGRVYNLQAALASALMADGCAELFDLLPQSERRERDVRSPGDLWQAADRGCRRVGPRSASDPDAA